MNETVMIGLLGLILSLNLASKKKPVFGQLTLTGELALDWLKDGTEAIVHKIKIGKIGAFGEYNVPDWANERNNEIGVLIPANEFDNAILVTQKSVLRALEQRCCDWEAAGALAYLEGKGDAKRGVLEFQENQPKMVFKRAEKGGQFAPYIVEIEE